MAVGSLIIGMNALYPFARLQLFLFKAQHFVQTGRDIEDIFRHVPIV